MTTAKETPKQITDQLRNWWICFWLWNIAHYALGLSASICTVLIAKNAAGTYENMPVFVAVATAAMTFLKSGTKANAYIAAWRSLNAERILYELDPDYSAAKLAEEHKKGEGTIGKAD